MGCGTCGDVAQMAFPRACGNLLKWALAVAVLLLAALLVCPAGAQALVDGDYTVDVMLEGGSGRASVDSPAQLSVDGGAMAATIVWSSSNYDLMVVDGQRYAPVAVEEGATFEIPVDDLGSALDVQAETTAMSSPHLIDYQLVFDASSVQASSRGVPVVWVVLAVVCALVVVGAIIVWRKKARRA